MFLSWNINIQKNTENLLILDMYQNSIDVHIWYVKLHIVDFTILGSPDYIINDLWFYGM